MVNKKAEKYGNFHRVLILDLLKQKSLSVTEISKQLENYPRVAVEFHLKKLLGWGLVKKLPEEKTVGNPIRWAVTPKADPIPSPILAWANKMFQYDKKLKKESFIVK